MRIVFMGTPDFAVPSLQKLLDEKQDVCAVYCQPDKPKGRGHKFQAPPVKELALQYDIPVYQPVTLRDAAPKAQIAGFHADVIVVAAYGKLLPKEVLEAPKYGCVNVHASLLPKYRGAAPIQWAVINGEKTTGITTMLMAEGMDTGDILDVAETEIRQGETAGALFDRLKLLGADLLWKTLQKLEAGTAVPVPQNHHQATPAPMLKKSDGSIDWGRPAKEICQQILGTNPWPGAYTGFRGKQMKLYAAQVLEKNGTPGSLTQENGAFIVFCGTGALQLTEIQPENGKRMTGTSFLLGHPLHPGEVFEELI